MNRNMTSNVSPMWDKAMPELNLRDMHQMKASDCLPHLDQGVLDMAQNKHQYDHLEPDNGWGSFGGALAVLVEMAHACRTSPDDVVWISY